MNLRAFVLSIIQPIEEGKTVTADCPICGVRGKFTATVKDDTVLYNCYRDSCHGSSGKFSLLLSPEERVERLKRVSPAITQSLGRQFTPPSYWVDGIGDDRCLKYMESTHMMDAYKKGLFRPMYDPAEQRFVFPIRGSSGQVEGAVGRSLTGDFMKVRNYNRTIDRPFICGSSKVLLLTEDCASAVAATRGNWCAGMALLGTKVRQDFIKYMQDYEWVGIALDKDAHSSAFILKRVLTTYLKDVRIRKLPKDIKDMSDQEYETWAKRELG